MADFQLVDPRGWEWDLQSVYSAYMNHFQLHNVPWYDRSWGHLFSSFETFLAFGWPVICVTDSWTGRPHIVTRTNSIGAFLKMIKTRFGEILPVVDNMLRVTAFETQTRHLRTITDVNSYKKLYSTLPAAVLAAQKIRVRSGEPNATKELWEKRDKTFLAIDFEWSERNIASCLEWGYAAVRCSHLDTIGVWPPVPETNYRKGHFIVAEYVDKVHNKHCPTFPWEYAFGESQVIPKAKLGEVVQATISSLASPDSETVPNQLVLVTHGVGGDVERLADLKVKLPSNVLVIDTASLERQLFSTGLRPPMLSASTHAPRQPGTTLSLSATLRSLHADPGCRWHCAGNDALGALLALQMLLEPAGATVPPVRKKGRGRSPGTPGHLTPPAASVAPKGPGRSPGVSPGPARPVSGYFDDFEAVAQVRKITPPKKAKEGPEGKRAQAPAAVVRAGAARLSMFGGSGNGSVKARGEPPVTVRVGGMRRVT